jgi:hypothetical protein
LQAFFIKDSLEKVVFFFISPTRLRTARAVPHRKAGMRATRGFKRPRIIYTKPTRMSINISMNSTIFQQFAAERVVCQPFFIADEGPPPTTKRISPRLVFVN